VIEAMFKSLGRALSQAVAMDPKGQDQIPSTKGML
jgi:imidazoleglycerol phosphate dehydratase HisB